MNGWLHGLLCRHCDLFYTQNSRKHVIIVWYWWLAPPGEGFDNKEQHYQHVIGSEDQYKHIVVDIGSLYGGPAPPADCPLLSNRWLDLNVCEKYSLKWVRFWCRVYGQGAILLSCCEADSMCGSPLVNHNIPMWCWLLVYSVVSWPMGKVYREYHSMFPKFWSLSPSLTDMPVVTGWVLLVCYHLR